MNDPVRVGRVSQSSRTVPLGRRRCRADRAPGALRRTHRGRVGGINELTAALPRLHLLALQLEPLARGAVWDMVAGRRAGSTGWSMAPWRRGTRDRLDTSVRRSLLLLENAQFVA
ncbi:MAG: hypothetical protein HYR74_06795 [Candidatus Eisenbacteria bacterium]|nr:hypothetical protein [Candidatus Eisenbacteria bacterium]